ncbi:TetR/AcrR family transcriptional regulator [Croceicoccus naphthovorans]|uniref:TetR family transcriptional regulator n=1 Tax=Croceicoccus naphthovorans TaxID=1348774 RepID=A0A0G3XFQ9_9SPHN|nr:TetR/AcrR family transcriptional regulator [Croceicoccus naphthovorans]AKM10370.1 TetR family transcriptional regulator [Croceicoccus naphthovorans]MBB3990064.1 AcrR family transcriptional regulator [Croceicoccus naphthovorans]
MSTIPADEGGKTSKEPRTERGRRTLRKLLDAAAIEFGEKGFHEASISGITRRAGTALGSFYTYFDSKDEIFRALVSDMSGMVRARSAEEVKPGMNALEVETAALTGFLKFAVEHKEIYRIVDEAEFVDPDSYREHYVSTAKRILSRLENGMASGEFRPGMGEAQAWALMGMYVFLGMRYAIMGEDRPVEEMVAVARGILENGIRPE